MKDLDRIKQNGINCEDELIFLMQQLLYYDDIIKTHKINKAKIVDELYDLESKIKTINDTLTAEYDNKNSIEKCIANYYKKSSLGERL